LTKRTVWLSLQPNWGVITSSTLLGVIVMDKAEMPHAGHAKHLCYLNNLGYQVSNPKEFKALVKDGKFLCKVCGRVAVNDKNLCKPVAL